MRAVKIDAQSNGAHRNQDGMSVLLDGWAMIPEDMVCENFPFGEVTAAEIDGVMTVTKWAPGVMPETELIPEPEPETSVWDELDAAYQEGVDSV